MMKYVVLLALSVHFSLAGLFLDNADIRLLCPQRGQIEVILHRYEHTQQSRGSITLKPAAATFAGAAAGDPVCQPRSDDLPPDHRRVCLLVCRNGKLVRCRLLSLTTTYPVDIPYYRE